MKSQKIGIIDYGAGNMLNVVNALKYWGAIVDIITNSFDINSADKLVLPGVGAFQDGMSILNSKGLTNPIKNFINSGRPYLGICLGMQFLFERSYEFGVTDGFGIVKGEVCLIPSVVENMTPRRVPHVGWSKLRNKQNSEILKNLSEEDRFYFTHSYRCIPKDPDVISAIVDYQGLSIVAAINQGNVFGTQFHPEKSGASGLKILENFLHL